MAIDTVVAVYRKSAFLLGFYTMLAFNANAVELELPEHLAEPPLPV